MNIYVFRLTDNSEIEIQAASRVCAMEIFEDMYYENGKWKVEVKSIDVKIDEREERKNENI